MGWSTREVAELAGTSARAVRHYHKVGLLDEPERRSNGYKQYGVVHLVRLVRIRRFTELGFSLPQIAAMGPADHLPKNAFRQLDAELGATIQRLQTVRDELRVMVDQSTPSDLPPGLVDPGTASKLSDAERSLVVVLSRVLGPRGQAMLADMMRRTPENAAAAELAGLPPHADGATRQYLAERLAPHLSEVRAANPALDDSCADAPHGKRFADRVINDALLDLYNPAQLDVLRRAGEIVRAKRALAAESASLPSADARTTV